MRPRPRLRAAVGTVVVALFLAGCSDDSGRTSSPEPVSDDAIEIPDETARANQPVRPPAPKPQGVPRGLTPPQLAGQRTIFPFEGTKPPRELVERIGRGEAAGVILFGRNVSSRAQVAKLTARLQAIEQPGWSSSPLIVMADQEGGQVVRIPTRGLPSARALATGGDERSYGAGLAAAKSLRAAGVNVNLAPIADVADTGSALAAQDRLFGSSPDKVAVLARAFSAGLADGGVAATAKHFPGFGSATSSTDYRPVTIPRSKVDLERIDLPPFAALIDDGVPLVMVSTAVYSSLADGPAVFARSTIKGMLRRDLGFEGVTVTDDLETPALASAGTPAQLAPAAAAAGNDLLLFAKTYAAADAAANSLARAFAANHLDRKEARRSAARVLVLRESLKR